MSILDRIMEAEVEAIQSAAASIDRHRFNYMAELLATLEGKLIVTGVGKSAIAARKVAATLATCHVSSFFVDPIGLYHGELGVLSKHDLILMVSASGETEELTRLLPSLAIHKCTVWTLVGNADSFLGRLQTSLSTGCTVDPLFKVPTASSAAAVAIGDALAIEVAHRKGFTDAQLRDTHPGGTIGEQVRAVGAS